MYCLGHNVVKSHDDARKLIKRFNTPLTTHFYEDGYCEAEKGRYHLPSTSEAQEFLDLLLELAKTFPQDNNPEFIRVSNIDFSIPLSLMQMAKVDLSEHDKMHVLNYATTELFDCEYLNYSNQIRDAWTIVNHTADFWEQVVAHESYCAQLQIYKNRFNALSHWHLIKRYCLLRKILWWNNEITSHATSLCQDYGPRALSGINEVYQTNLEYGYPLVFYHPPKLQEGQSLFDEGISKQAQDEWKTCALHTQFGDEKFARLLDLMQSFCQSAAIYMPDTETPLYSFTDCVQYYPELAPYHHLLRINIDMVPSDGRDWDRFDKGCIKRLNQSIAEVFHCEKYLDQANTSFRRLLPTGDHPEDNMTPEELNIAKSILNFMENNS